jgi:hypothetical protein
MAHGFQSHSKFPNETTSPWIGDTPSHLNVDRGEWAKANDGANANASQQASQAREIRKSVCALVVMRRVGNIFVFNRSGD